MTTKPTVKAVLKWTALILSFLLVLILLATWLINREPIQGKIRRAVTAQAGNLVTFRHLDLALLPRPHLTLTRAAVSVPGSISAVAQTAVVYPEILPLFTGRMLIARVRLEDPDVVVKLSEEPGAESAEDGRAGFAETRAEFEAVMKQVRKVAPHFRGDILRGKLTVVGDGRQVSEASDINASVMLVPRGFDLLIGADTARWGHISVDGALLVRKHSLAVDDISVAGGHSAIIGLSARLAWRKIPWLEITKGQAEIALEDVYDRRALLGSLKEALRDVKSMKGRIAFAEMSFKGPLLHAAKWKFAARGSLEGLFLKSASLSSPVSIERGSFVATEKNIALEGIRGMFLDSPVAGSVSVTNAFANARSLAMSVDGTVGHETVRWADKTFGPSPWFAVRTPLSLSNVRFRWKSGSSIMLSGRAAVRNGPALSLELQRTPGELRIGRLVVEDGKTGATLALMSKKNVLDVRFKGSLNEDTMNRLFARTATHHGWIRGDLQAHLLFDRPAESTAQGTFEGADLEVPYLPGLPVSVQHISLRANGEVVHVNSARLLWADIPVDVKGEVRTAKAGFRLDLDAGAGSINMDRLNRLIAAAREEQGAVRRETEAIRLPLRGVIRFYADAFTYGRSVLKPFRTDVQLLPDTVRLKLIEATLCGISVGGTVQPFDPVVQFDLLPIAVPQQLEPVLDCLWQDSDRITGTFNLYGFLKSRAASGQLIRSLQGHVEFSAKNGKFYRYPLLARVLAFLNVTELLRGKLPDMGRDGFAYDSMFIKGDILNGRLVLREASVEGATLNLAAEGVIDFTDNTIDITVLVAPFKTIEYILSHIPVVKHILANKLITVPVRLTGDLRNPDVTALSPEDIGENILDIMKKTLAIPFKVLDPLIHPGKK